MYYVISADKGQIVELYDIRPTWKQLKRDANYFGCEVYVIEGEHVGGMEVSPGTENEENEESEEGDND